MIFDSIEIGTNSERERELLPCLQRSNFAEIC